MFYVELAFRWLHILSAIALMGGTIFMRFGLHPALHVLAAEHRLALQEEVRRHWAKWVMAASGFLLLSGLVNTVNIVREFRFPDAPYHLLIGVKLMLALAIFFIASILVGRSANAARFREKAVFWLNLNLALALAVVLLGGFLKITKREPKAPILEEPAKVADSRPL